MKNKWLYGIITLVAFAYIAIVATAYRSCKSFEEANVEMTIACVYETWGINGRGTRIPVYVVQLVSGEEIYTELHDRFVYAQCKEHVGDTVELMYNKHKYGGIMYTSNWRVLLPWDTTETVYEIQAPYLRENDGMEELRKEMYGSY